MQQMTSWKAIFFDPKQYKKPCFSDDFILPGRLLGSSDVGDTQRSRTRRDMRATSCLLTLEAAWAAWITGALDLEGGWSKVVSAWIGWIVLNPQDISRSPWHFDDWNIWYIWNWGWNCWDEVLTPEKPAKTRKVLDSYVCISLLPFLHDTYEWLIT